MKVVFVDSLAKNTEKFSASPSEIQTLFAAVEKAGDKNWSLIGPEEIAQKAISLGLIATKSNKKTKGK